MDVTTEIHYPGARIDEVVALVLDPEFRAAVCDATMAIAHEVDVQRGDDGSAVVTVNRTLPAEVPDFIRRFVGETIELAQAETWEPADGSVTRRADLSLQVVGQPAAMTGSIVLRETSDGVHEVVRGELKVSLPFIGGKIEAEIAKGIVAAARKEQETGRTWLSG